MSPNTIQHYMRFVTEAKRYENQFAEQIFFKSHDGRFEIVATKITGGEILSLWNKSGHAPKEIKSFISINTYFTDKEGNCLDRYNITHKRRNDGKIGLVVDFDYLMEWNEANIRNLVAECVRMREMDIRY